MCIFLALQSKLQLMSCYPEHPSTYHSVFAKTVYTQKRRDTIIGHVLQHMLLLAQCFPNCLHSQVNMAEADVAGCTGNKESFFHLRSWLLEGWNALRTLQIEDSGSFKDGKVVIISFWCSVCLVVLLLVS